MNYLTIVVAISAIINGGLVVVLMDPMLTYVLLVSCMMYLFPEWSFLMAISSIYSIFQIHLRSDPFKGNYTRYISTVGMAIDSCIRTTLGIVMLLAMIPSIKLLMNLSIREAFGSIMENAFSIMMLFFGRSMVETLTVSNISEKIEHITGYGQDAIEVITTVKTTLGKL